MEAELGFRNWVFGLRLFGYAASREALKAPHLSALLASQTALPVAAFARTPGSSAETAPAKSTWLGLQVYKLRHMYSNDCNINVYICIYIYIYICIYGCIDLPICVNVYICRDM